jgi:pimeloyl-ACP methyl ester carboxylesterase
MNATISQNAIKTYDWNWQGRTVHVTYEVGGSGRPLLLLPAFSTVCSRSEVAEIARLLADRYQTIALDWPGFGDSERPKLDYGPALYQQFLADFLRDCLSAPAAILVAGHGAGYALHVMQQRPEVCDRLILVAPTWRGPLPTMLQGQKSWFQLVRNLVRTPVLGQFLYQLNTTKGFLSMMYRRHVYADQAKITAELIDRKQQLAQRPGARFGPVAFVTGGLDPVVDRASFQQLFQGLNIPVLVMIGADSPPKSLGEMQAIATLPAVESQVLPGTLGLSEESAELVAAAIRQWGE